MRWPWTKSPPEEITLDAYQRWLEAGSPDFWWFMRQSDMAQDAMANTGADYVADCANAYAQAVLTHIYQSASQANHAAPASPTHLSESDIIRQVAESFGQPTNGDALAQALQRRAETRGAREETEEAEAPQTFMGQPAAQPAEPAGEVSPSTAGK